MDMTWPERRAVAQASVLLALTATSLQWMGFQKTYRRLASPPLNNRKATAEWVGEAVDIAARNLPLYRPTCLPRSLVLWHMLHRYGMPAEIRIGVRKVGNDFVAHAWVEYAGRVVNDATDIADRFALLDLPDFRLEKHRIVV